MRTARGFTLVELLATAAVAAVLCAAAAPSLQGLVRSARVTTAANDLFASLTLTRSEAMKRHQRVVMCRSADGLACSAAAGWQQGWIVFEDADGDGLRDPGERLLQVQPAVEGSLSLTGTATVAKYVSYVPNGGTRLVGGGFQAGTLTICSRSERATEGRQIVVNANGRPRTVRVQLPSCG